MIDAPAIREAIRISAYVTASFTAGVVVTVAAQRLAPHADQEDLMHDIPIDLWHAALLMPIIWTFAACFYAGMRWERARRPSWSLTPPPEPEPQPVKPAAPSRYDRGPLRWIVRLFLRISAIGHRH